MAPRAAVRSILGNDAELNAMDFTLDRIFSSNVIDTPSREFRWMIISWIDAPKAFRNTGPCVAEIWVYQPKSLSKDYGVLDSALVRIKELLTGASHLAGADGWTLSEASWQGDSGDLTDEGFEALARFSRYKMAARPVVTP